MNDNPTTKGRVGYKRPPVERQFGQPNGNKPVNHTKEAKQALEIRQLFHKWLDELRELDADELDRIMSDPKEPALRQNLAKVVKKGDWNTLIQMMNQIFGLPKQEIQQTIIEPPAPLSPRKQKK